MTFTSVSVIFLYQPAMPDNGYKLCSVCKPYIMQELFSVCKTYSWCKLFIMQELFSVCKTYSWRKLFIV